MSAEPENPISDMEDSEPDDFEVIVIHHRGNLPKVTPVIRPVAVVGLATKILAMYSGATPSVVLAQANQLGGTEAGSGVGNGSTRPQPMSRVEPSNMQRSASTQLKQRLSLTEAVAAAVAAAERKKLAEASNNRQPQSSGSQGESASQSVNDAAAGASDGESANAQGNGERRYTYSAGVTLNAENLPDLSVFPRMSVAPSSTYRYRLRAINSCGNTKWSELTTTKASPPGYPGAPCSVRITYSSERAHIEGAQMEWEPPQQDSENSSPITEYAVYMAVKPSRERAKTIAETPLPVGVRTSAHLAFIRVYVGQFSYCTVSSSHLANAYIDMISRPAIIFRIAARNEKGYGQATQVRWVQDPSQNGNTVRPVTHTVKSSNGPTKRLSVVAPGATGLGGGSSKAPRESGSSALDI